MNQWTDLKSRTKGKASGILAEQRKTGGGEIDLELTSMDEIETKLDTLLAFEKKIVHLNGKVWLLGIEGGLDTAEIPTMAAVTVDEDGEGPADGGAAEVDEETRKDDEPTGQDNEPTGQDNEPRSTKLQVSLTIYEFAINVMLICVFLLLEHSKTTQSPISTTSASRSCGGVNGPTGDGKGEF